ncbi:MAG: hypothetical protein NTV31_03850 [Bacteroidia bacterium]|nr:hypothetical protein [Bacteroidia bacterium]
MSRFNLLVVIYFIFFTRADLFGIIPGSSEPLPVIVSQQDTLKENQNLYNGRIWRNLYYLVKGNQFLFSKEFLPGSLSINGKTYANIFLKYDIYKDEILTPVDLGGILQLNKEMVDSFSVSYQNKTYRFIKMQEDSTGQKRYFNVLFNGKTTIYIKYNKKIDKLAEGEYDRFYQIVRTYLVKDNIIFPITGKSDLLKILIENNELIKNYIKKNKLKVSEKVPESFIPVIRYYDSLNR